jgi:MFS superfamily sulfate permease-like transporter
MQNFLIGLGIGVVLAIVLVVIMSVNRHKEILQEKKENERLRRMLNDRMDLESDGLAKLKEDNEELKKQNENLRISINTYMQKPNRKEIARLHVYQLAVDRLTINSPGFGAAWQAALKESEEEFQKTYVGVQPFIKRLIPMKTDANVLPRYIEEETNKK